MPLLTVDEAKTHLNITTARDDGELAGWIDAATAICEHYQGVLIPREHTQVIDQRPAARVALEAYPVLSLTSVAPVGGGASVDVADLDVEGATGIVVYSDGRAFPTGRYRWVYQAGREVIPANVTAAARILVQHFWQTQRGSARSPRDADMMQIPGLGYAIPNRAAELLGVGGQAAGFA